MFQGSFVALITPFRDGKVDEAAFRDFVEWQIAEGTDGLVPCGTTGESPTLSHEEHMRVVEICIEVANKRVPVIAGTGSNSTAEAIALSKHAKRAGADAALVVTPYYNKPTQEGLYQHYAAIQEAAELPVIIYNIPGRSVVDMTVETMARLAKLPNIAGVKDATNDLARPMRTRLACGRGLLHPLGRGRHRRAAAGRRRPRLHLGDRQHRPAPMRRHAARLARRRYRQGHGPAGPVDAAARQPVLRDQPRPGEVRGQPARQNARPRCACPCARSPRPARPR